MHPDLDARMEDYLKEKRLNIAEICAGRIKNGADLRGFCSEISI